MTVAETRLENPWRGRAPGRINVIGEHVDYVGGLVLPAAIDRFTEVAGVPATTWSVQSADGDGRAHLEALGRELGQSPQAVSVASNLPVGAGLSSSAALLVAACAGLVPQLPGREAALICQRAEQAATGVMVGAMDQLASALGQAGHALLIDCSTLDVRPVPFPSDLLLAVIDSGTRRELAATPYNQRRREAEAALGGRRLLDLGPGDVGPDRRLRHLVSEVGRVREAAQALAAGDGGEVGRLMTASHQSLRDDFEVSTAALDALVEAARSAPGCLGARLMGAGFGGSVVALIRSGSEAAFATAMRAPVMICRTASGPFAG